MDDTLTVSVGRPERQELVAAQLAADAAGSRQWSGSTTGRPTIADIVDGPQQLRRPGPREVGSPHRPDIVLTGHVHQSPFKPAGGWVDRLGDTWIFNGGRQIGPIPARVEIDLTAQTAEWSSMLGVETQDLTSAGPGQRTVF
jgi:hypothetical protein